MFEIRLANYDDVPFLPTIEEAASNLFLQYAATADLPPYLTTLDEFYEAQKIGHLWIAAPHSGAPVGFALLEILGGFAHLEEIDVDPNFGRLGIGANLVKTVCTWAQTNGISMVTLTTFRDIPWNEPFYRKLGFDEIKPGELTADLINRIEEEARYGLPRKLRITMRYKTGAA